MKRLSAVLLATAILFSFTGCSRFGANDNPPMQIPVHSDRFV